MAMIDRPCDNTSRLAMDRAVMYGLRYPATSRFVRRRIRDVTAAIDGGAPNARGDPRRPPRHRRERHERVEGVVSAVRQPRVLGERVVGDAHRIDARLLSG